jgi:hypothetical protein
MQEIGHFEHPATSTSAERCAARNFAEILALDGLAATELPPTLPSFGSADGRGISAIETNLQRLQSALRFRRVSG